MQQYFILVAILLLVENGYCTPNLRAKRQLEQKSITLYFPDKLKAEQALIKNLTTGYDRAVRPQETVDIYSLVELKQIISIDEKNQIMTSTVYISQAWYDPRLVWNSSLFRDVETIMIPAKLIWIPDIFIMNTADTEGYLKLNSDFSLITISHQGVVFFILPVSSLKTRCSLYTRSYPFDRQQCNITYGSWSQGSNRISLLDPQDSVDITDYTPNPIWQLIEANVTTTLGSDRVPFEDANNTNINIQIFLRRKPLFFMMNGVFACLILNCVTLLLFALPFTSQLGLSLTCFMTYSVYSITLSNSTPTQSDFIPLITLYFVLSISFSLLSLLWFVLCNQWTIAQSAPEYLIKFSGFLQRVFFCCFETSEPNIWLSCCKKSKTNDDDTEGDTSCACCFKAIFVATPENVVPKANGVENQAEKCHFCDRCAECQKTLNKEKEKDKNKKFFEKKMSALNYLAFIIALIYCLIFQLSIWLSLSK